MARYGRVLWSMRHHRAMCVADLEGCLGAVQNHQGRHWVALRCSGQSFLYMDSLSRDAHPKRLSAEEADATRLTRRRHAGVVRQNSQAQLPRRCPCRLRTQTCINPSKKTIAGSRSSVAEPEAALQTTTHAVWRVRDKPFM
eukprot:s11601_g1.t1